MPARIAIPEPTSLDRIYNGRSLQPYLDALEASGASPVCVGFDRSPEEVTRSLADVQGVLLPGSRYDVEPRVYGETRIARCGPADPGRAAIDELLLKDSFDLGKPILAICYGVQALNVWRGGTLVQDLGSQWKSAENHQPGRDIARAHPARIAPGSRLASLAPAGELELAWVNSSHHQAVRRAGGNLRVTAVSPRDGVIEAVELDSAEHFVLGVQWHPERTFNESALSRSIFAAFVRAVEAWRPRRMEETVPAQ